MCIYYTTPHHTGELGKSEELAGRAKDGRVIDPSAKVDGVKLEYRDEFGRKLTQKEAFRQICYRFHGYGPGKKAKEKRLKVQNAAFFTWFYLMITIDRRNIAFTMLMSCRLYSYWSNSITALISI